MPVTDPSKPKNLLAMNELMALRHKLSLLEPDEPVTPYILIKLINEIIDEAVNADMKLMAEQDEALGDF